MRKYWIDDDIEHMRLRTIFLIFVLAELASLAGYFFPWLNTAGFFLIVGVALILSLRRLEYGLYFVLEDLILGGKSGALFSLQLDGFFLSLRMALFIVVMAVWGGRIVLQIVKLYTPSHSPSERGRKRLRFPPLLKGRLGGVGKWWAVLAIAIVWGMVRGFTQGNGFGNVFLDANGYFYAALVLPVWWSVMRMDANVRREWMRMLMHVFFAATTLLALKTLFAVYIFTHAGNNFIAANLVPFYRWVRDTGVGEITWLEGNFARVFFQSHVYNVVAFFAVFSFVILRPQPKDPMPAGAASIYARFFARLRMTDWKMWTLLVLNLAVILVSLSRSFWVGTIAGLGMIIIMSLIRHLEQIGRIFRAIGITGIAAVVLILVVSRFPFPRPSPADLTDAARSRLEAGEAGQSRFNLLPPLMTEIREHPILGSGFGKTVTYISNDPRIREVTRTGEYTTYAFEWGWLDLWLKVGVIGLIGLLGLIGHIGLIFYRKALSNTLALAGLAVLIALAAINVFTPYLNHPLGLGILALLTVLAECDSMGKVVILAK